MHRYLKTFVLAVLPALIACGGFFCTTSPIDQGAERIIFAVNGDGTITATVGINYVGSAEDFSWVVPVPSPPELDVAETAALDTLELMTNPQISTPRNYCNYIFNRPEGLGGGGGDDFLQTGQVGPYDYAIIRNETPGEMIAWLRDNGYQITEAMEPLVTHYADMGMYFLAMRLQRGQDTSAIQPVVMTYESEKPMIPIILTSVAAVPNMPILTWIFGETQYVPENFANPKPDYTRFRAPGEITGNPLANLFNFSGLPNYVSERNRLQAEYDGKAFITEYAGSTAIIEEVGDPYLEELAARFPYMTRLRAQMSPEQMTLDPVFAPAPDAPDVSNNISLGDYVDPLDYWECSSRAALDKIDTAILPPARVRLDDLRLHLALPEDWQQSEFTYGAVPFIAFSPEPVTAQTFERFLNDESVPPALLIAETHRYATIGLDRDDRILGYVLGVEPFTIPNRNQLAIRLRYNPIDDSSGNFESTEGVFLGIMASADELAANSAFYEAMLTYAGSYQYFMDTEHQHTLFLRPYQYQVHSMAVPFGEGWRESTTDEGDFLISRGDQVQVRLVNGYRFEESETESRQILAARITEWLIAETNLPRETIERWFLSDVLTGGCFADLNSPPIPFEHRGMRGYVRFLNGVIAIGSTPAGLFEGHEDALLSMLEGATLFGCTATMGG